MFLNSVSGPIAYWGTRALDCAAKGKCVVTFDVNVSKAGTA